MSNQNQSASAYLKDALFQFMGITEPNDQYRKMAKWIEDGMVEIAIQNGFLQFRNPERKAQFMAIVKEFDRRQREDEDAGYALEEEKIKEESLKPYTPYTPYRPYKSAKKSR
jgi:hypothetical protein